MKIGKYEIDDKLYEKLNSAWKSYSVSVLKGEIGELKDFLPFIEHAGVKVKHSKLIGDVLIAPQFYENTTKVKALKDIDFHKTFEPLDINEMKDIDSIVEAIQERIFYTGNIILGNSMAVEKSTSVFDSAYVYMSSDIFNTKYCIFCEKLEYSKGAFGSGWGEQHEFVLDVVESGRIKRGFSVLASEVSSDIYYSSGIINSQEIMFSFGIRAKKYVIGNQQLDQSKYLSIKDALLEQLRDKLKKDKKIPLLLDLVEGKMDDLNVSLGEIEQNDRKDINPNEKEAIDKSFSSVTGVLFRKKIEDIDTVNNTLENRVPELINVKSILTENVIQTHDNLKLAKHRIVEYDYIFKLSDNVKFALNSSLEGMFNESRSKMILPNESRQGENGNIYETAIPVWSHHIYKSIAPIKSKYIAYSFWPIEVEHGYGVSTVSIGKFMINTYSSKNIKRGFEVDNSRSSSDVYYCHNCEDVKEAMFSFNIKGKHNAIGNAELDAVTYARIKKSLLEQIYDEFSKDKLKYDIYNIIH